MHNERKKHESFVIDWENESAVKQYLADWLPREIPISSAFGMEPASYHNDVLALSLPLMQNRNHMNSGFGGSLYVGALLVGWSWLHLALQKKALTPDVGQQHIVIQKSEIQYSKPMLGDALAICRGVTLEAWQRFEKSYRRAGRGRLQIETEILYNHEPVVNFVGDFVVYNQTKS